MERSRFALRIMGAALLLAGCVAKDPPVRTVKNVPIEVSKVDLVYMARAPFPLQASMRQGPSIDSEDMQQRLARISAGLAQRVREDLAKMPETDGILASVALRNASAIPSNEILRQSAFPTFRKPGMMTVAPLSSRIECHGVIFNLKNCFYFIRFGAFLFDEHATGPAWSAFTTVETGLEDADTRETLRKLWTQIVATMRAEGVLKTPPAASHRPGPPAADRLPENG
jgi:hypothetical protein